MAQAVSHGKFGIGNSRTVEFDVVAANAAIKERVEKDGSKGKKGAKKKKGRVEKKKKPPSTKG